MAKSKETFGKKEKEKKRLKKRKEKEAKREERKANSQGGGLDAMLAYVDEFGNLTDTPPDPLKKKTKIDHKSIEIGVPKRESIVEERVKRGRVEFFNHTKGFGFIKDADTHEKYFVHINGVLDEIKENDRVTFELVRGMKGMNAVKVQKV